MDIAIVGLSGLYPDADGLDRLYANLSQGVDSVRPLSEDRLRYLPFKPSEELSVVAGLAQIDAFDHEFFGISLREAEYMDPQHRLLLQLACGAIENAGFALGELRGSDTGVFIGAANTDYYRLIEVLDPMVVSGNLPSALAGRIAYQLGLRGPALVIDTACSSSLVAVIEACNQLALEQVDYALAGGINVFFMEDPLASDVGIAASDGKSKAFDAAADGSGWGEGGGAVLLTTLRRALEERLPVHAVIKGGAVNQDAERSNGITAPSALAQGEVIAKAWARAGVEAGSIGYVEAHGTGTQLGDPIEIQGLNQAFGPRTEGREACPIGSIKTNVGHLMGAAGIAGLTKAVLALEHRKLFPSLHYRRPNPFIDFGSSAVAVNARLREWEPDGAGPRRAGVSSFGLSGTNAHLVLEEAPAPEPVAEPEETPAGELLVTLSARSRPALKRYLENVSRYLEEATAPLADVAFTLNRGRDDHPHRFATWAGSREELRRKLEEALAGGLETTPAPASGRGVVFLLSDGGHFEAGWSEELAGQAPELSRAREDCRRGAQGLEPCAELGLFGFLWGLQRQWRRAGVAPYKLIGTGPGSAVAALVQEKLDLEAALRKAAAFRDQEHRPNLTKLRQVVEKLLGESPAPVFLELGADGTLWRELGRLQRESVPDLRLLRSFEPGRASLLPALCELYRAGVSIDWDAYYQGQRRRRVELPTYPFEPTPCWNPAILKQAAPASVGSVASHQAAAGPPAAGGPLEELPDVLTDPGASPTERALAGIWAQTLKAAELTLDSDYFDLGGHSLNGVQVVNRIADVFSVELDFDVLYDYPTLRELAGQIDALAPAGAGPAAVPAAEGAVPPPSPPAAPEGPPHLRMPAIQPAPAGTEAPLSFTEQRLWFLDQFEPGSPFYNIPFALRVRGPFDTALVQRALEEIRRRHEILRTVFPTVDGRARRQIEDDLPLPVEVTDLRDLPPRDREAGLEERATQEAGRGFDLARGPLTRVVIVRLADDEHALLITLHHIISDLWTMNLLIRELSVLYQAYAGGVASPLPELPIQYSDFARTQRRWLQGATLERLLAYWKEQLEGTPPLLTLPTDRPRPPAQTYRGRHYHFTLPAALTERLNALARGEEATLFMVLMAGLQALLYRHTGEAKIPVGTPIAGRNRVETEGLIGFFANTLVIVTDLGGDPTVRELLARVRKSALGAYAHQELPFEKLLEEAHPHRSLSHSPLFQVMLALQNIAIEVPDFPELALEVSEPESGTTQFDLTLSLREDAGALVGRVQYNTDLYEAATIERMAEHLEGLLEAMASSPGQRLEQLPMWRRGEREQVVTAWNDTRRELAGGDRCLHQLIAEQAARSPAEPAVISHDGRLTYAQLDERAGRLAALLARRGVGPESVVALCARRSLERMVALLAILKAGAAYLPLEPDTPPRRRRYMLDHSGVRVIVGQKALLEGFEAGARELVELESGGRVSDGEAAEGDAMGEAAAPTPGVTPDHAAYVIYTSGTTGNPKGVVIPHRGIVNRLLWMQETYRLDGSDRVLQKTPYSFDVSVWELFWPLLTGAALVMARPEGHRDPHYLMEVIREQEVTTLHFVPSMLSAFLQAGEIPRLPSLRRVICSGEALGLDLAERFFAALDAELHNLYGPTEASVDVSFWPCRRDETLRSVPIGRPIANTTLYVLNRAMEPVAVGVTGELAIGGVGLARGYASDPAQTAERFVPDPFGDGARLYRTGDQARWLAGGALEFLGRLDHQVKIRGFRIEAGEIESALCAHPQVEQAVVVARERSGHRSLVAYLVPAAASPPPVSELREHLKERLPEYMLPAQVMALEALPLTPSGKVNRNALPEPSEERPELEVGYQAPGNPVEERLAEIWSGLLGVERIGVRDNFFAVGGDSILSIQVVARAREAGIRLTPRQMFEYQTIAELAAVAGRARAIEAEQGPVAGEVELTPVQRWLLEREPEGLEHWNQAVMLAGDGAVEVAVLERVLAALVEHHDALRHRFEPGPAWRQSGSATAEGCLRFTWQDLSGVPEAERPQAVARLAEEAQTDLDLRAGPLVRASGMAWDGEWRLLLVIHHLVVDGVSWRILLGDLQKGYRQLTGGGELDLGRKTTSFQCWARRLARYAREESLRRELSFWLEGRRDEVLALPRDREGENLEGSVQRAGTSLDEERTRQLLTEVPKAYSTNVQEVLLTALSGALLEWSSRSRGRVLVELEGHGREELFEEVDLTRTVGWLTALYPVSLPVSLKEPVGEALKRTKEILRRVPAGGVGYGVLRYLGDRELSRPLAELPRPELLFNYLGRLDRVLEHEGLFRAAGEDVGPSRSPRAERSHLLEVNAGISGGRLELGCTYSSNLHEAESVEGLVELTHKRLLALIDHCLAAGAGEYTPSDFPDEILTDRDLGEIVAQVRSS